jgi:hypothetical protein
MLAIGLIQCAVHVEDNFPTTTSYILSGSTTTHEVEEAYKEATATSKPIVDGFLEINLPSALGNLCNFSYCNACRFGHFYQ